MTTATLPALAIQRVPLDELRPDPANPRRIGEAELDALTRSMRRYGLVPPILVRREDSTVIGGHQRLVAARRLGLATVPVIRLDLSTEQARIASPPPPSSRCSRRPVRPHPGAHRHPGDRGPALPGQPDRRHPVPDRDRHLGP